MRQNIFLGCIGLACFYFLLGFTANLQENRPPKIKIIAPIDNSSFRWNSIIPYTIHVSDYEDGNSDYDEIFPNEVILIVEYLKDSPNLKTYLSNESKNDNSPLVQMGKSTCFSCHKAKGKLIGPSFELIANKYQKNAKSIESLTNKIMTGSSATWGDEEMPPHPDLDKKQVEKMVNWILDNNTNPYKNYLTGIEGALRTKEKPESNYEKGVLVLTASYTDHGVNDNMHTPKQVQKTIVLTSY